MKKKQAYFAVSLIILSGLLFFSLVRASTAEYLKATAGYRDAYNKATQQVEAQYKSVVDAADKIESDSLKTISSQLSADQITEDEYYSKVSNIQNTHKQTVDQAESILTANRKIAYQNYQAQRKYAWDKYVLGKDAAEPVASPLTPSKQPTAVPIGSPQPPATVPLTPLLPSSAGPLVVPSCYPPEPGLPSLPPAAPSRFSNCKDIVISPYGPFLLPIPNIQSTQPCPPGTTVNYGQCGSSGVALQLSFYGLTTDASNLIRSKGLNILSIPSWSSSDPSVVSIENGALRPLKTGKATITITDPTSNSCGSASVEVTVVMPIKFQQPKLVLDPSAISLAAGEIKKLSAHYTMDIYDPYDESTTRVKEMDVNTSVKWTTTDPTVVTVDAQGNITEQGVGTAKITVSYCNTIAEAQVAVTSSSHAPAQVASLDEVCADKADIPNREKALGVMGGVMTRYGRDYTHIALGSADFTLETGKYSYIKFDYNPWDKALTDKTIDNSLGQWNMMCADYFKPDYGQRIKDQWAQWCKLDDSGKPILRPDLTASQKVSCAWGMGHCSWCSKTADQLVASLQEPQQTWCNQGKNDPNSLLSSAFYQKANEAWRAWAESTPSTILSWLIGNIDTVRSPFMSQVDSGQMWLAYECLPTPQELKGAGPFKTDFSQAMGDKDYFVMGEPFRYGGDTLTGFGFASAKPGRYYLILRADTGSGYYINPGSVNPWSSNGFTNFSNGLIDTIILSSPGGL